MRKYNKLYCGNCGTSIPHYKFKGYFEVSCPKCGRVHKGNK